MTIPIRPPKIALIAIAAMMALHVALPLATIFRPPFSFAGAICVVTGAAMIIWARRAFQAAGTPIKPFTESTELIRHGLYHWTRNPMYLGAVLVTGGVAVLLGSLAPALVAILFFAILREGFVRREERLLEESFGDRYRTYRQSVRRWL